MLIRSYRSELPLRPYIDDIGPYEGYTGPHRRERYCGGSHGRRRPLLPCWRRFSAFPPMSWRDVWSRFSWRQRPIQGQPAELPHRIEEEDGAPACAAQMFREAATAYLKDHTQRGVSISSVDRDSGTARLLTGTPNQ